jgi:dopamine receptor D1
MVKNTDFLPVERIFFTNMISNNTTNGVLAALKNYSIKASSQDPYTPQYTLLEAIVIGTVLTLLIVFAIGGNILVCVAILTDRNLRKTSNYFIISLAIADMLVASLVMSFAVGNDIMGYWPFAVKFCSVWISFDIMCSTASILNLCTISLDRYIHIRNPLHYETWMTTQRSLLIISIVWVLSALISFLPIHLGWHQTPDQAPPAPQDEPSSTPVEPFFCVLDLNPLYAVVSSLISFYVPCLVMILIYLKLYQYARKHVKSIKKTRTGPVYDTGADHRHTQSKVSDHKAAITLGFIMGSFLICWVPFFTINVIGAFCHCIPPIIFSVFTWLGYFNSTLNPVIYSIFNTEFREAFKRVLSFARCTKDNDRKFSLGRSSRTNGITHTGEYGALCRKSSTSALVAERITSL